MLAWDSPSTRPPIPPTPHLPRPPAQVTAEVVHIDFNVCFEKGAKLRVPETVPFRRASRGGRTGAAGSGEKKSGVLTRVGGGDGKGRGGEGKG